jgi:SAM-dependent methyltransferase
VTARAPVATSRGDGSAADRWRRLVTERLAEMERLSGAAGPHSSGFWDRRADRYAASVKLGDGDRDRDPLLRRLRRLADASSSVIDVGAGTGRYALALAPQVGHVTAVDPSTAMLAILEREAGRLGVGNVTTVTATWEEAETQPADIVLSSFVLPLVPDARPFLAKLDAAARHRVVLYLGAFGADAVLDPLWRHFHGTRRAPGATFLDAVAVLRELGIDPHVKVVEVANPRRFATIDEAVDFYLEALVVGDTPDARNELAGLLGSWLVGRRGALRSPMRTVPAAIVEWTPGPAGRGAGVSGADAE